MATVLVASLLMLVLFASFSMLVSHDYTLHGIAQSLSFFGFVALLLVPRMVSLDHRDSCTLLAKECARKKVRSQSRIKAVKRKCDKKNQKMCACWHSSTV